jgi:hypothetical protein
MVPHEAKAFYAENGYARAHGLFRADEVDLLRGHYMTLRRLHEAEQPQADRSDPLKGYPRMLQMHRWDDISLRWLLDARLNAWLTALIGREPYAVQTMIYFKPPGARGQALHQDNYYLRARPGTCMAAWMALDPCDEENGCLQVVPGSQHWPILCTEKADTAVSFTDITVPLPQGAPARSLSMNPGDVLFFNGSLVHGSYPNSTTDRFRRALIGHYIDGAAEQVATYYHPALRMDGTPLELAVSGAGGPCGVWVDRDGVPVAEMAGLEAVSRKHE